MTLITERLLLRPFNENDFEAAHAYAGDYENLKYMIWGPNSEDDTKAFIKEVIEKDATVPQYEYDLAVTLHDGKLIGACAIHADSDLKTASLGWVLHKEYWKQGFGTELAGALLKFGFNDLKLHRITSACITENYGSYRVMERNGMRREGCFLKCQPGRECDPKPWYDKYLYAILEEEWRENNSETENR